MDEGITLYMATHSSGDLDSKMGFPSACYYYIHFPHFHYYYYYFPLMFL